MGKRKPSQKGVYRFIVSPKAASDPRSVGYLHTAHTLGIKTITRLDCSDLYFVRGKLTVAEVKRLAAEILSDPVTQIVHLDDPDLPEEAIVIETALRPGVTDPVATQIVRSARLIGIQGITAAATGLRFVIRGGNLNPDLIERLTNRLLVNPVIQRFAIGEIDPSFPAEAVASGAVEMLPIRSLDDAGLLRLSQARRAALDLAEMQAIQAYCQQEGRDLTDVEFETIAQTWSEHCVHKTFKARIELSDGTVVNNLFDTYIRSATAQINAPWLRSVFVDNAGIVDFDDDFEVSFKVETHNHPSAIEPFGGANTGTGGVIRDVLGVSAKPIAATDVLCFGPPDLSFDNLPAAVLHPRRIRSGVVAGIQDYGNKIGIPTVSGAVWYDPGFTANPLVFCGCVGLAPKTSHPRQPLPGDHIIVLGGRTGRDGLRGATFSSQTMDAQTGEVAGASVQIGDPITEKGLIEVILRARDQRLYHAITDCGAGGLSSAVGEMSSRNGAEVELAHVRLKYPGLAPWEIWLSEAQERMVLAVPVIALPRLQALCNLFDVEITDIGVFTGSGRLEVRYQGKTILDLANAFLHGGIPQRQLTATVRQADLEVNRPQVADDPGQILLALLAHPNIASKASVIRIYDHEVQGGTLIKPLTGIQADAPSDAVVLKPIGTDDYTALVLSAGLNPEYGKLDPYRMALSAIDEAIRNAVAVGADPSRIALLDNFCWGDPRQPETLGELVAACQGCHDGALRYQAPFISGKDSLNNEYLGADGERHAIPPTLLISALGRLTDFRKAISMDLKEPGNIIYLVGELRPHYGGSHYHLLHPVEEPGAVPDLPAHAPRLYRVLHDAIQNGWVRACHDLSEGGLAVAAAEMCIGGRLGMRLILDTFTAADLFGETNACLLAEVHPADALRFETAFDGLPLTRLGKVSVRPRLVIDNHLSLPVNELVTAWNTPA